ncbi:MAG: hypothetical protein ACFFBZ_04935 [Promethearchaeota archaeon]
MKELILKTCVAIIPVKELPWVDLIFRTIPRIIYENNQLTFLDNAIAYYGEIKCFIGRTTVYGKIKDQKPLFAPFTGNLDLHGYKLDDSDKDPKSKIFSYINAIINSMDSTLITSQLAKYHENFQRHGDPICDFLMGDEELLESMEKIKTGLDSSRIKSDITICSLALPLPSDNTTLVLVAEEGDDQNKYSRCFEAFLKLSAACCQLPSIKQEPVSQPPGVVSTPGGQQLKTWTAEELAQEAQKRMTVQPNIPVWTENELAKFSSERGSGIPEGMEVWTEEDLQELAEKRRGGGLNIPEWAPDEKMTECFNCGYSLRPGWTKCPICETPVGEKPPEKPEEGPPEEKPSEEEPPKEKPSEEEPPKENLESSVEDLNEEEDNNSEN